MEIEVTQKLKGLETRKKIVAAQLDVLKEERKRVCADASHKERELESVEYQIHNIVDAEIISGPVITEHALLRYIERIMEFDIDGIKKELLPENVLEKIKVLGNGKFPVERPDGTHYIIVRDGKVLTIET